MGRYDGDPRTADEIIAHEKRAAIRRLFPAEFLSSTYDRITRAATAGSKAARSAKKLLDRREYDK
jgi:hypothetical protein